MSGRNMEWLSSVSDKPPDKLLDSDDMTEGNMEVDENSDSLSESLESSCKTTSMTSLLSMKSYASSNQTDDKENEITTEDDSQENDNSKTKPQKKSKPKLDQPITPVLRRSSRANKGIGKEIFDPSHIPASQKKYHEPKRFDSPNTERSSSPSSSIHSSPRFKKGRMVVGRSPKRRSDRNEKDKETKNKKEEKRGRGRKRGSKKSASSSDELKPLMTKDDFSDDDDNVPLKLLKDDDDEKEEDVETSSESESESEKIEEKEVTKNRPDLEMKKSENQEVKSKLEEKKETEEKSKQDNDDKSDDDGEEKSDSEDDYSSDDTDDSYNNPERLWCICRKPHNNRFMISCDQCEDWFHGDCVGISLQQGRKMEENNEEYICPKCHKSTDNKYYKDSSYVPDLWAKEKKAHRKSTDETPEVKVHKRSSALDEKIGRKNLKGYVSGQIQSTTIKKESSLADAEAKKKLKEKAKVESSNNGKEGSAVDSSTRKCIVMSCCNDALPGSVYCSNQCILKHAKESLMSVVKDKEKEGKLKSFQKDSREKSADGKPKALNPNRRISVICRKTRKILTGPAAPRRKDLAAFLKKYPTYKVYRSPPSAEGPRFQEKPQSEKKSSSTDFYKHVESQHRKRDRYGPETEHATVVKKVSDGGSSLDKKHRVIKASSQSAFAVHRSNSSEGLKSGHISSNKPKHVSNKPEHSQQSHKHRPSTESSKKHESSKLTERRSSKDHHKRKQSAESKEDRPAKKVERSPSSSKPKPDTAEIRQNIKKSLFDILKSRSENSEDLKMHPDSIMRLAAKIEDSLFKVFNETSMKYKNKYRSMMFNLKDQRNHGLWRKVIIGEVTTGEFVQMTAEQMASKKLAEWRKNELTQELDIIKKQEKEIANIRPVAKITHKGEIAIQEDLSDMTENFSKRDSVSVPTIAPVRKKRISLSEEDPFEGSASSLTQDTTLQHNEHLFDHNCKICTGRMKEEDVEQPETPTEGLKKVKRSTSIILSSEAQQASSLAEKDATPTSHIVISEKPRIKKKRKKEEEVESNINSHDPSLSPTSFLSNLSKEKEKKKKPILPSPPPLSDIAERPVEPEPAQTEPTPIPNSPSTSPSNETPKIEAEKEVVEEPQASPETPNSAESPPKPTKSKLIWSGSISMLDLSTFKANVYPANGVCDNLDIDLPVRLVLGGRIHPKVVWDYLGKISVLPTKQLSVVRFHAASDDDRVGYVAMLSYFSSRKRFGVVSNQDRMLVKDMYLIPLLESHPIPEQLVFCSPGIENVLPPTRPSMLLGIVVRQVSAKPPPPVVAPKPVIPAIQQHPPVEEKSSPVEEDDEEYIPDEDPPIKERTPSPAPLLTDEELAAKTEAKPSQQSGGSLLERNRSLAPSLRFFMRKQSEEEQIRREQEEAKDIDEDNDDRPYSPGEDIEKEVNNDDVEYDPEEGIEQEEEDEPYDPEKMYEEQEEYDPETAFAPESPKRDEDLPYDPEDAENLIEDSIESNEVKELVEKQAFIERMQRELEEKKAKLAQVEQSLQQSTVSSTPAPAPEKVEKVEKPRIMDPRLARRAAAQDTDKSSSAKNTETSTEKPTPAVTVTPAAASSTTVTTAPSKTTPETLSPSKSSITPSDSTTVTSNPEATVKIEPKKSPEKTKPIDVPKEAECPKDIVKPEDPPKSVDTPKPVDPLQTILSVLNMAQQKSAPTTSSVAGALKIFQKQASPPPLPDSTTKSDPEDGDGSSKIKGGGKSGGLVDYAPSPDSRHGDDEVEKNEKKKTKKNDQKRRRSSSNSSSSSREEGRRRHRHDYDDKHRSKRHRRSRSRSPRHHSHHHHRHHDDHHRRRHDRSWSRDRRR